MLRMPHFTTRNLCLDLQTYCIVICHRINCNCPDAHFFCCSYHPAGNFSSIGDEDLVKVTLIWIKWVSSKCWKVPTWDWNWSVVSIRYILEKKIITVLDNVKAFIMKKLLIQAQTDACYMPTYFTFLDILFTLLHNFNCNIKHIFCIYSVLT